MKLRLIILTLFVAAHSQGQTFLNANVRRSDASAGLPQAIARVASSGDTWVAWTVPGGEEHSLCCGHGEDCCTTCSLDGGRSYSKTSTSDVQRLADDTNVVVIARITQGEAGRIRIFGGSCRVDAEGATIHLLESVPEEASLDWLGAQLATHSKHHELMVAIAMHGHSSVVPRLIAFARNDPQSSVRRAALFWLGQRAGEKAAAELRRAVDEDPEDEVRSHAVFAISQLPADRSVPMLIDLVKTHKSRNVRKKAMFWLAQKDDPRALETIEEILR